MSTTPIPLTVIGGFLGAGKTTAVNAVLADAGERRIAVLVNDFGDLAIDAALIARRSATTIGLTNGCVCCSLVSGLTQALIEVLAMDPAPDHIVVEASGVSDPRRIMQFALADAGLKPDATLVLVAADQWPALCADPHVKDTVTRQIAAADLLIQNKVDLVTPEEAASQRSHLSQLAPKAHLVTASHARLPCDILLGHSVGHLMQKMQPAGEQPSAVRNNEMRNDPRNDPESALDHAAHAAFSSRVFRSMAPISKHALCHALEHLPRAVLRAKGLVRLAEAPSSLHLVQAVGTRWSLEPLDDDPSIDASSLVVIGASIALHDADLQALAAALKPSSRRD